MKFIFVVFILLNIFDLFESSKAWSKDIQRERWNREAIQDINRVLNKKLNGNIAKNIILFLGDGMGMSTITAGL
jgi:alkaline phosphatase